LVAGPAIGARVGVSVRIGRERGRARGHRRRHGTGEHLGAQARVDVVERVALAADEVGIVAVGEPQYADVDE